MLAFEMMLRLLSVKTVVKVIDILIDIQHVMKPVFSILDRRNILILFQFLGKGATLNSFK